MKQGEKHGSRNKTGAIGEDIAARHLKKLGLKIVDRNYLKKWGEIDIVSRETSENKDKIHFVEVKTVSYETMDMLKKAVSYGTWRPEENVHPEKVKRLHRTIESWLMEHNCQAEWQIDVISVRIVPRERFSTIKIIENVIL